MNTLSVAHLVLPCNASALTPSPKRRTALHVSKQLEACQHRTNLHFCIRACKQDTRVEASQIELVPYLR